MKIFKLLLAAVGATVLLGTLVSGASARNLSFDNQRLRATFREVRFHLPGESTVTCELILEKTLHRLTMPKVVGSLIGYITSAILGPCQNGGASIQRETLPWHIRYSGFQGTLPNITSLITHIVGMGIRIRDNFQACLIRSSAASPVILTYHRDASNHLTVGLGGTIGTGIECFGIHVSLVSDSPRVVLSATTTAISLRLI
jgi:hypothetical protein